MPDFWKDVKPLLPAGLVSYAGVLFWFVSAPDFRFGYGFILITLALVLVPFSYAALRLISSRLAAAPAVLFAVLVLYQGAVLVQSFDSRTIASRLLLPLDYLNLPTHPCHFGNFDLVCADQFSACSYSSFPCVPQGDLTVFERGRGYREGFFHLDK
jgi:hypothetical protein